jgi:hypothetical protein
MRRAALFRDDDPPAQPSPIPAPSSTSAAAAAGGDGGGGTWEDSDGDGEGSDAIPWVLAGAIEYEVLQMATIMPVALPTPPSALFTVASYPLHVSSPHEGAHVAVAAGAAGGRFASRPPQHLCASP